MQLFAQQGAAITALSTEIVIPTVTKSKQLRTKKLH